MKSNLVRQIRRMAVLLIGSAVLGTLFLTLVFCLPVEPMRKHVSVSVDSIIKDEDQVGDSAFARYIWKQRESYTDAIMVQNAIEKIEGKNVYEHAMWAYHMDVEEEFWTPEESLKILCDGGNTDNMYLHEYSRYWHGYLIYLKPLLLIFSWSQIVIIGIVLQIVLMVIMLAVSIRSGRPGVGIAMLAGFLFMKPVLVLISLTMSVCWIITLAAVLVMLLYHDRIEQKEAYPEVFLMIGILVGYFDFLTYPVVTLGFPLCAYFLIKKEQSLKQNIQKVIGYSGCWGIGYAGMWAMKWLIADITLHTGTIKDALWSIIGRTESIGGRPRMNGGFYVILLNLQEYQWKVYFAAAALLAVLTFVMIIVVRKMISAKQIFTVLIPYAVIFCIPFVWIIAVQHHSALHARFTFRIISVAVLAVCCMGIKLWQTAQEYQKSIKKHYKNDK